MKSAKRSGRCSLIEGKVLTRLQTTGCHYALSGEARSPAHLRGGGCRQAGQSWDTYGRLGQCGGESSAYMCLFGRGHAIKARATYS